MCVVSNTGDYFRKQWENPKDPMYPFINPLIDPPSETTDTSQFFKNIFPQISKQEFDDLKKQVEEIKTLLLAAKKFDETTNQPHCEMDDKVALLKKIGLIFGVNMDEVFKDNSSSNDKP